MIYGNTDGIKNTILKRIEALYEVSLDKENIYNEYIFSELCNITEEIQREISIASDRRGRINYITIGDSGTVEMPKINISENRLSGVKIIHTHPNGNSMLSALDISALIKYKLDLIAALGVTCGKLSGINIGFIKVNENVLSCENIGPLNEIEASKINIMGKIHNIEEDIKKAEIISEDEERALLIGIEDEESIRELSDLADACDIRTLDIVLQKRSRIDSAFYIGSGKVKEISYYAQSLNANVIIFDDELSGSQVRNLEENIGLKVIDRTTLILEIFSKRARTREAMIQVECAQLKYRLARLYGLGTMLSRTGGGIGTRGPGEKKLETDKRHIHERLYDLQEELKKIKKYRDVQREKRNKDNIQKISLVGYTNAGKSTLRNILCRTYAPRDNMSKESVFEADMLFATLDVTTRAVQLPDGRCAAFSDTVGFIKKLPHDLIEAFKATLEEVVLSDLLVHVIDVSNKDALEQIIAVENVLCELKANDKPQILVLNKIDCEYKDNINKIKEKYKDKHIVLISARVGKNLDGLLNEISNVLPQSLHKVNYSIPYSEQSAVAMLHRNSKVLREEYQENGSFIEALVDEETYNKLKEYMTKN